MAKLLTVASFLIAISAQASYAGDHKTILISCDAFRWNYILQWGEMTPNINYLVKRGAFANYGIRNQFTTITLPNHVTLATGRNVDDHGIVGNDMWDDVLNESFTAWADVNGTEVNYDDGNFVKDSRWMNNSAEPIWVTLGRQNVGKSAVVMWPFSSYTFNGAKADYWIGWNGSVAYERRIDLLISQLRQPNYSFGVLYFEELDNVGHKYGPNSPQIVEALERIDNVIGYLLSGLSAAGLWPNNVDIFITADHGMTEISSTNAIYLPLYVNTSLITVYDENIFSEPGFEEVVFRNLSRAPHLRIYRKYEAIPAYLHFSHHRRLGDIIYFHDDGWYLSWDKPSRDPNEKPPVVKDFRSEKAKRHPPVGSTTVWGSHGYDNRYESMWPIFVAAGPSFKQGVTVDPFNNTQVYCIICALNRVQPHPLAECDNTEETPRVLKQTLLEPPVDWPSSSAVDSSLFNVEKIIDDIFSLSDHHRQSERPVLAIVLVSIAALLMFFLLVSLICRLTSGRKARRQLVIATPHPAKSRRSGCYKAATCGNSRPVYAPHSIYAGGDEECLVDSDDDELLVLQS